MKPDNQGPSDNSNRHRYEHHEIMTLHEVADYLGLHYLTIYRLIQEGRIPAARLGGRWRFKKDVLDRWIENDMHGRVSRRKRRKQPPPSPKPDEPESQDRKNAA